MIDDAVAAALSKSSASSFSAKELVEALRNKDDNDKHQAHGISVAEMKKIKEAQRFGKVEKVKANKNSRFEIPKHEAHFIHFSTERVQFNEAGEKQSKPHYHVKTVEDFERMSKTVKQKGEVVNPENAFAGMRVIIFHDPRQSEASSLLPDELTLIEELNSMTEEQLRAKYTKVFGEEALPSDTKKIMIELIKEKLETAE